jgi:sugar/nucleoside kinase (ribokinase family)
VWKAGRVYAAFGEPPEVVVVGAASRDVAAADPRGWRLGGAVTYCSLTAARLGLRVGAVIGLDRPAAGARELALLEAAGVALRRMPLAHGPVFENIEGQGARRQRWLSRADALPAGALPRDWREALNWLLVPVAGEVGEEWAAVPGAGSRVAVGWQGLMRELAGDGWVRAAAPRGAALWRAAGLLCGSVDDFPPGLGAEGLRALAPEAVIVATDGERGGRVLHPGGAAGDYRALASTRIVDPTGAGDVFLAALMAAWLRGSEPDRGSALLFAAAAASCSIEAVGVEGVPTPVEVGARLARVQAPCSAAGGDRSAP